MRFHIDNTTCGGWARAVTAVVRGPDPAATVRADPPARIIELATTRGEAEIYAGLAAAAFPPR